MALQRIWVLGVPVKPEYFKRSFLQEVADGEPAELLTTLVPMEDAELSFQILRLSAAYRLPQSL